MVYDFFEELKDIIKEKLKECYVRLKNVRLVIIFIILLLLIFMFKLENPESIETQQLIFLGITLDNWAQWITTIALPYTAGWAIYQYKKNLQIKKQEKASNIAKEFSNSIVEDLSIVNEVIQHSYLSKYIPNDKIDEKLKYFNVTEIRELYKSDSIVTRYEDFKEIKYKMIDNIYHLILYRMNNDMTAEEFEKYLKDAEDEKENWAKIKKCIVGISKPYHFYTFETKVLNKLEYLCMDISSKAADSKFIYQSLHQMFLRSIRNLYFEISIHNINSVDKLFTNIIYVYNEWRNMYKVSLRIERRKNIKRDEANNLEIRKI